MTASTGNYGHYAQLRYHYDEQPETEQQRAAAARTMVLIQRAKLHQQIKEPCEATHAYVLHHTDGQNTVEVAKGFRTGEHAFTFPVSFKEYRIMTLDDELENMLQEVAQSEATKKAQLADQKTYPVPDSLAKRIIACCSKGIDSC